MPRLAQPAPTVAAAAAAAAAAAVTQKLRLWCLVTFLQVTSDKAYTYYRIKVNLNETFFDTFTPDPKEAHLSSTVVPGDVFDNSTGIKVHQIQ